MRALGVLLIIAATVAVIFSLDVVYSTGLLVNDVGSVGGGEATVEKGVIIYYGFAVTDEGSIAGSYIDAVHFGVYAVNGEDNGTYKVYLEVSNSPYALIGEWDLPIDTKERAYIAELSYDIPQASEVNASLAVKKVG